MAENIRTQTILLKESSDLLLNSRLHEKISAWMLHWVLQASGDVLGLVVATLRALGGNRVMEVVRRMVMVVSSRYRMSYGEREGMIPP